MPRASALYTLRALGALLIAVGAAAAAAAGAPQEIDVPAWFRPSFLDFRDDAREAAAARRHLMVYFGQNGCPYCKQLVTVTFRDAAVAARAPAELDAVEVNIVGSRETVWTDGTRATEKALAARLGVRFTPTLLFVDGGGRVVLRLNGYYEPQRFLLALDYVAGGEYRREPDFRRYLQARGVSTEERGSRTTTP